MLFERNLLSRTLDDFENFKLNRESDSIIYVVGEIKIQGNLKL
jgi:hypothetical protein